MADLIDRQAAIDAMFEKMPGITFGDALNILRTLPSAQPEITGADVQEYCRKRNLAVITNELLHEMQRRWSETAQPERKKGKWILKPNIYGVAYCSECDYELHTNNTNYCPHCGARMSDGE